MKVTIFARNIFTKENQELIFTIDYRDQDGKHLAFEHILGGIFSAGEYDSEEGALSGIIGNVESRGFMIASVEKGE